VAPALARAGGGGRELGLPIPEAALDAMRQHLDDADHATAAVYEKKFRHDVMAHVHAFGGTRRRRPARSFISGLPAPS
jgi:adenylosuccinate lyase